MIFAWVLEKGDFRLKPEPSLAARPLLRVIVEAKSDKKIV